MALTLVSFADMVSLILVGQLLILPVHPRLYPLSHTPHLVDVHLLHFEDPSSVMLPAGPLYAGHKVQRLESAEDRESERVASASDPLEGRVSEIPGRRRPTRTPGAHGAALHLAGLALPHVGFNLVGVDKAGSRIARDIERVYGDDGEKEQDRQRQENAYSSHQAWLNHLVSRRRGCLFHVWRQINDDKSPDTRNFTDDFMPAFTDTWGTRGFVNALLPLNYHSGHRRRHSGRLYPVRSQAS